MRGQVPGDWVMTQDAPIVVVGAGGHGKVVLATIEAAGGEVAGVLDDDAALWGTRILGHLVTGPIADASIPAGALVLVAAGANRVRKAIAARLRGPFGTVVHPSAVVHSSVALGAGTVVLAGAIIQPDTTLGGHVIVNTGASADHDCVLGDYVHIAPGVRLAGDVRLDEGVFMGVGSCAIPGARVGRWATIGAGGVVLDSIPPGVTAVGLPARVVGGQR
jgi:sugar O-acyltransferase (sialic acid O-acetyltransferase NeuD family)